MKGLFYIRESIKESSGISKKILSEVKSLKKNGMEVQLSYLDEEKKRTLRKVDDKVVDIFSRSLLGQLKRKIFYYNKLEKYILENDIEFIYIRYTHFANSYFVKFLKRLKENGVKIFLEIPTYPYDNEYKDVKKKSRLKKIEKEKIYRIEMGKYIDKIITFSEDDEIFGVKTIKINNGIDLETIKLIEKNKGKDSNEINFIGVAGIAFWHGFDRMILSMAEYYKNNPKEIVRFHIVGDGDKKVVDELKNLVKKNNLEKYVIFYGYKSGKDLDEIYNKANIAVGSLGGFRKSLCFSSALKSREYCAKGLPFILGGEDLSFNNCCFIFKVLAEENLFNINDIINWYKNLKITSKEIRKYAEENLTWDKQMKKVVDYILETGEKENVTRFN